MSSTTASLRRKIKGSGDLRSVVRTMKAVAAANINQYVISVQALVAYNHTIELGLSACFRKANLKASSRKEKIRPIVGIFVFGSDQGLVGQFNDIIADYANKSLVKMPKETRVWPIGERVNTCLIKIGVAPVATLDLPTSVQEIPTLVNKILSVIETRHGNEVVNEVHLFYNHPQSGATYEPMSLQLLPLDQVWQQKVARLSWPDKNLPEIVGSEVSVLRSLIREFLFVSIFRACAESLASENASRLASMQRADKNINEILDTLTLKFHQLRQSKIDEELFDVVAGFEALV